jgi:taurine dioxygenase
VPELNVVSNVGRETPPRSDWHVDTSYVREPPAYTALRAVEIPSGGGETLFSNQYRAFETLPVDLAGRLAGRTITHVVTGVELEEGDENAAEHPIFRPHPLTGRPALYLTTPARCAAISGMDAAEAEATIALLLEHSTREDNVHRHRWSPGDVVMWDNACVLHRADHSDVLGDRVMHRGMVAGYGV